MTSGDSLRQFVFAGPHRRLAFGDCVCHTVLHSLSNPDRGDGRRCGPNATFGVSTTNERDDETHEKPRQTAHDDTLPTTT
jgi:hypothetical protein